MMGTRSPSVVRLANVVVYVGRAKDRKQLMVGMDIARRFFPQKREQFEELARFRMEELYGEPQRGDAQV